MYGNSSIKNFNNSFLIQDRDTKIRQKNEMCMKLKLKKELVVEFVFNICKHANQIQ